MKRLIEDKLLAWKDSPRRKALIVRGARQVGKTFSIEKFGRDHFEDVLVVDLEKHRNWHRIFSGDIGAREVLAELELETNHRIQPGKTLLFLDEVQACPRAIVALRYLYEECPELHVIAAGSLLEFALGAISFPVGRVQSLTMHAMTFVEYLWAVGRDLAAELVMGSPKRLSEAAHQLLLEELRRYFLIGGMPTSVLAYTNTHSFHEALEVHATLCDGFRQDFSKYAPRVDPACLDEVLTGVARYAGQQVRYTRLAPDRGGESIKNAFDLLCKARLVARVAAANPAGPPLGASASVRTFKAILVDIGLWQHLCGMKVDIAHSKADLLDVYRGAMAEQFVGQEMLITQDSQLYYWSRQAPSSTAEVDYLAIVDGEIVPIEVKSGPAGRLRSLHMLLQNYPNCPRGLVFSSAPYAEDRKRRLTFLPLYFAYSATSSRQPTELPFGEPSSADRNEED
jgi:predicted AAA+ superfamily ATPase